MRTNGSIDEIIKTVFNHFNRIGPVLLLALVFVSTVTAAATYYVDDYGPNDPNVSDPLMDGSFDHPFDQIQKGIDAADSNSVDTVIVLPGTYYENIAFDGKDIVLTSIHPVDPNIVAVTVIDGNASGSVVTFSGTETADCELRGFTITNGVDLYRGGGICGNGTKATVSYCTITNNSVIADGDYSAFGGGMYKCDGIISHCIISGNTAQTAGTYNRGAGGGLYICGGIISNCIVAGNTATGTRSFGGGLANCNGMINNCVIVGNRATGWWGSGGGLDECDGYITNCVLWGNIADSSRNQIEDSSIPTYSCIEGWTSGGTGNISGYPMFRDISSSDPLQWDLRLLPHSGCIDAGTNTPPGGLSSTDIKGTLRPFDGNLDGNPVADIGAYEYCTFIAEPAIAVLPDSLRFSALEAGGNPAEQVMMIRNMGNQALHWTITDVNEITLVLPDWLSMTQFSGDLTRYQSDYALLSVGIAGLANGCYHYEFDVCDPDAYNSPQTVSVNLEVIGPQLTVSSDTFEFTYGEGPAFPTNQVLTLTNSAGGTLNWLAEFIDKPDWLNVTTTSGSIGHNESDNMSLSVDTSGLTDSYSYTFTIIDSEASHNAQEITVILRQENSDYGGGRGTEDDPYQIWTPEQLNTIGIDPAALDKCFKLIADIDTSDYTGTEYHIISRFSGVFDGNGYTISNLSYTNNENSRQLVGFLGYCEEAVIKNLNLKDISISSVGDLTGGLIARSMGTEVRNCHVSGYVSGRRIVGGAYWV